MRQMPVEGGFQGRTNKLVDGCYSFWQGATFSVVTEYEASCEGGLGCSPSCLRHVLLCYGVLVALLKHRSVDAEWFFNRTELQEYILICCQEARGGLIDKPGKYV
jgi:protein farnesyltransferase subunit beta